MKPFLEKSLDQLNAHFPAQWSPHFPRKVYLDLTQDCNMFCIMCRDSIQREGKSMDFSLFQRVVKQTRDGAGSYSLFNWGEPLLLEDFRQRVVYVNAVKRPETKLDISTNGMLLDLETIAFLVENDVQVTVSFDAADKETFESIRRGSHFETVCENLRALCNYSTSFERWRVPGIYVSMQKMNWKQVGRIVRLAHQLGVQRIGFGPVVGPVEYRYPRTPEALSELERALQLSEELGMYIDLFPTCLGDKVLVGNHFVSHENFVVDRSCDAPLHSVSVAWNGDVFLCCNVGAKVGNLNETSFQELWNGSAYDRLRKQVNDAHDAPSFCRECAWVNRF